MSGNVIRGAFKDPKKKSDIIDRITSADFSGDLRDLAVDRDLRMHRIKPHMLRMKFGKSGEEFDLAIHKTRGPRATVSGVKVKVAAAKTAPVAKKRGRRGGSDSSMKTGT